MSKISSCFFQVLPTCSAPVRWLNLQEYQSKKLMKENGIAVQDFRMAENLEQAADISKNFSKKTCNIFVVDDQPCLVGIVISKSLSMLSVLNGILVETSHTQIYKNIRYLPPCSVCTPNTVLHVVVYLYFRCERVCDKSTDFSWWARERNIFQWL